MEGCPNCHRELAPGQPICPHCGSDAEQLRGMLQLANLERQRAGLDRPGARPRETAAARSGRQFPLKALVIGGLLAAGLVWMLWPETLTRPPLAPAGVNAGAGDPCQNKPRCVVAYLAPWCPACKATASVLRLLVERYRNSTEVGIQVVIGSDSPQNLEKMAEGIGSNVFLDPLGEFYRSAGISFVPTLWLIDAKGKVRKRRGGGSLDDLISDFDLPRS